MFKIILFSVSFLLLISFLIRYIELKSIFYPTRGILVNPTYVDLNFEDVFFKTKDNVTLHGWFVPCKNAKATLIYCHGNAGNISHRLEKAVIFHHLGLNSFLFDYRGYGNSQGAPTEKGIYLDAQAAYDYLLTRNDIDKEKIIGFGSSLGGAAAIDLAVRRKLAALIVDSSFTCAKEMGKTVYPFIPAFVYTTKFDSIKKVKKITTPKLFIHSMNDEIVPFALGQRLFDAAIEPKDFLWITGGHNTGFIESQHLILGKLKEFLKKYGLIHSAALKPRIF